MADTKKGILIRLTADQHAEITTRAKEAGVSINRYAIGAMLGELPTIHPSAPAVMAKAEAALVAALQALRGAQAEAPTLDAPDPIEAAEADVAPEVQAAIYLHPSTVADLIQSSRPAASPLEVRCHKPSALIVTGHRERRLQGVYTQMAAKKIFAVGTPVALISEVFEKISGPVHRETSLGEHALVGRVTEGGIAWEALYHTSSQHELLHTWATTHGISRDAAEAILPAPVEVPKPTPPAPTPPPVVDQAPAGWDGRDSYLEECDEENGLPFRPHYIPVWETR